MCDAVRSLLTYRLRLGKLSAELLRTGHSQWLSYFVSESMTRTQRSNFCRGSLETANSFGNFDCDNIYKNKQ